MATHEAPAVNSDGMKALKRLSEDPRAAADLSPTTINDLRVQKLIYTAERKDGFYCAHLTDTGRRTLKERT